MKLMSLNMFPIHAIPQQVRRLLGVQGSADSLQMLADIVSEKGNEAKTDVDFNSTLSEVVGYSDKPDRVEVPLINVADAGEKDKNKVVSMEFNKDTNCFNFVMTVTENPVNDVRTQEVQFTVTGYTSRAEQSLSGLLPDDLVFYINEIYGVRVTYQKDPFGNLVPNYDSYTMLSNLVLSQSLHNAEIGYVERSINIIDVAKSANTAKTMIKSARLNPNEKITLDPDSTFFAATANSTPRLLDTNLKTPTKFISAIATGQLNHLEESEIDDRSAINTFFAQGDGVSIETAITGVGLVQSYANHGFIKALKAAVTRNVGGSGYKIGSDPSFTLGQLRTAIVNPEELTRSIVDSLRSRDAEKLRMASQESTDDWVGIGNTTTRGKLIGYEIGMRISNIMSSNKIGQFSMMYDNRHADIVTPPTVEIFPQSVRTINRAPLPAALAKRFKTSIEQMFVEVSKHNRIKMDVMLHCVLGTVNRIEITIDGFQKERLTLASMFDSRLHFGNTLSNSYTLDLVNETAKMMEKIEDGYNDHSVKMGQARARTNLNPTGYTGSIMTDTTYVASEGGLPDLKSAMGLK